jgi:hypothetical protein
MEFHITQDLKVKTDAYNYSLSKRNNSRKEGAEPTYTDFAHLYSFADLLDEVKGLVKAKNVKTLVAELETLTANVYASFKEASANFSLATFYAGDYRYMHGQVWKRRVIQEGHLKGAEAWDSFANVTGVEHAAQRIFDRSLKSFDDVESLDELKMAVTACGNIVLDGLGVEKVSDVVETAVVAQVEDATQLSLF